jgi:RND family efflux transporter MFP subunit
MSEPTAKTTPALDALRLDKNAAFAPRRRRRWPWVLLAIAALAAAAYAFRGGGGVEVETMTVPPPARPDGEVLQTATGYVVARRMAAVSTKIPGRLAELLVEEGSRVREGDVIARLEARDFEASLRQALASLESAKADRDEARATQESLELDARRLTVLFEQGLGSRNDADTAAARAAAARARFASSEARIGAQSAAVAYQKATLENTVVRAPFDGVVLTKDAEVGESVAPAVGGGGTTRGSMVTMADMASLEVEADVGEANIAQVAPGMPAEVVLDAFPDRAYPATVHQIVPTADRQKATVQIKVRFTGPTDGALPEMSAKVNVLRSSPDSAEADRRVITLPEAAVIRDGAGFAVVRVDGGRAAFTPVTLAGEPAKGRAEVVSGLSGGEEIVAAPPAGVKAGTPLRDKRAGSSR